MSEKVKLPREIVEIMNEAFSGCDDVAHGMVRCLTYVPFYDYVKLYGIVKVAQAVELGYEVENPQFKVDDTLIHPIEGMITVYKVIGSMVYYHTDKKTDWFNMLNTWVTEGIIRHATNEEIATEKQRRWWNNLNRTANEYKLGDICKWKDLVLEVEYIDQDNVWLKVFNHDEPESCGVCLRKEELTLVIPVEQRLDMKG